MVEQPCQFVTRGGDGFSQKGFYPSWIKVFGRFFSNDFRLNPSFIRASEEYVNTK
jgi:hypothetical protein